MPDTENPFLASFSDPEKVANYQSGPKLFTPGLEDLHRMTTILLSERVPDDGRILVLGAGGGLELQAMATARAGWTFEGVDPARPMLDLARRSLGNAADRVAFVEGYIQDASEGRFDGAVCLLTMHFLDYEARVETAFEIRRRLKPNAPFVMAHASFSQVLEARNYWLNRYAEFALAKGAPPEMVAMAKQGVRNQNTLLSPQQDEAALLAAGFTGVEQFYAAFTWRGWVSYA